MKDLININLLKNFISGLENNKKSQVFETPETVLAMSNHSNTLKDNQQKNKADKHSSYEKALRNFYIGLEGINTSVD